MKYDIELNGRFVVDINYWSGKTKLSYEGMDLTEDGKNTFMLGEEKCVIGGSLFSGLYLCRGNDKVLIIKLHWYDYIACILPFIVSLLGNAIGAIIGAVCFAVCYKLMPYIKNYALRLLICLGIAAIVFILIVALAVLFPNLFKMGQ